MMDSTVLDVKRCADLLGGGGDGKAARLWACSLGIGSVKNM